MWPTVVCLTQQHHNFLNTSKTRAVQQSAARSPTHPHQASVAASADCLAACDIMRLHGSGSSGHNTKPKLRTALMRQQQQTYTYQGIALSAVGTQAPGP